MKAENAGRSEHALAAALACGMVRVYKLTISPFLLWIGGPGAGCRFTPSCSQYFAEAVREHGAVHGAWLALKRIGRCHPWGGCGCDPVPPRRGSFVR